MSSQTNQGAEVCKAKSLCPRSSCGCAATLAQCHRAPRPLLGAGAGQGEAPSWDVPVGRGPAVAWWHFQGCRCQNAQLLFSFFPFFSSKPANQFDGGRSTALSSLCDLRGVTRSPPSIILN